MVALLKYEMVSEDAVEEEIVMIFESRYMLPATPRSVAGDEVPIPM